MIDQPPRIEVAIADADLGAIDGGHDLRRGASVDDEAYRWHALRTVGRAPADHPHVVAGTQPVEQLPGQGLLVRGDQLERVRSRP